MRIPVVSFGPVAVIIMLSILPYCYLRDRYQLWKLYGRCK